MVFHRMEENHPQCYQIQGGKPSKEHINEQPFLSPNIYGFPSCGYRNSKERRVYVHQRGNKRSLPGSATGQNRLWVNQDHVHKRIVSGILGGLKKSYVSMTKKQGL